ncbi:hypothetical protein UK23_15650 [Lentzea aerocolonigenes]|uniref:Peptidase S1A alpha-lytic prodomain domain-containing protein n=1 Tax=Lentzea aerocolonigenes TaxID=68170 RepID=A0A0F0H5S7_LENAE|nr:hypothetical protein UK23_15650 [Lentzea aerocolonigenes]
MLSAALALIATAGQPSAAPAAETTVDKDQISKVIEQVRAHPDDYTGMRFDSARGGYVLGVAANRDASASLRAATRNAARSSQNTVKVTVQRQRRSLAELNRTLAGVGAPQTAKIRPGTQIYEWYVDEVANKVKVGVSAESDLDTVRREFAERYGDAVEIFPGTPMIPAVKTTVVKKSDIVWPGANIASGPNSTRLLDDAPYSTGKRILTWRDNGDGTVNVTQCTDAVKNFSSTILHTAGHCFHNGDMVWQGHVDRAANQLVLRGRLGPVIDVQWGNGRIDALTIRTQGTSTMGNYQFTGGNTLTYQTARLSFATGDRVCTNGSFTLMSCNARVTSTNGCYRVDDLDVCGLDRIEAQSGGQLVQHGDSGGPVIDEILATGAKVGGIISAGNLDNGGTVAFSTRMEAACAQLNPYNCN